MNDTPPKTKVTLEDLLRIKRAEQPPAEFWTQFERGLRTKQLAAIVEPRPWWAPFIRVGARVARFQLPVGATAILAITLLTLREYHPAGPVQAFEPATAAVTSLPSPTPDASTTITAETAGIPTATAVSVVAAAAAEVPTVAPVENRSDEVSPAVAMALGTSSHMARVDSEVSSARYIADSLAKAQTPDPELGQFLGPSLGTVENSPTRSEPLAQITMPGENRRSRILGGTAWLASASTGDSPLRANESAARHLTERRLSESDVISRLNVGGNRVTVKF